MKIEIAAINNWLGKRMFLVVVTALILGFLMSVPDSPYVRYFLVVLFAYMTFVTALGTSLKSFIQVMGKPWIPLWVILLIHIMTPLTAWFLGNLLYADLPEMQLGLLVAAAIPVGVTSVMWTALTQGNVSISLVAVTLDTLIVPALLPAYYKIIVGQAVMINYTSLIIQLVLMVTIPSILGMVLYDWTGGKTAAFAKGIGGLTSKLALFIVIFFNGAFVSPAIHLSWDIIQMIAVALIMVVSAYALGYVGSLCVPNRSRDITMAMIYSVGMRNATCGLVIAITYFPPAVAVPIALLMLFQQPIAATIPTIFKYLDDKRTISPQGATARVE
ncbi:bile acid:sodium symporter family protein [Sporomusa sp. KB1]|jgi:predicted Na+-dependent transporter|uniref:bile acid:sodium symporter family protein n=1 Tax=Sporomusa sp. KB1 TaxID=943346 RepID=UPI0011A781EE|nr:bile acid:sodium symporter [Sporomusa sp. KB1]TWH47940.1 putative Na+-dependent transporter [Sporomusa sp. KB1]